MAYTFCRRTLNTGDKQRKMTFQASGMLDALQMASDYWFNGATVSDYLVDSNGVVTLLDDAPTQTAWGGNVIGTLMDYS